MNFDEKEIIAAGMIGFDMIQGPEIKWYQEFKQGLSIDMESFLMNFYLSFRGGDDELQPISSSIISPEEYSSTYHDFVTQAFTADNQQWAVALGANTLALFYHKDVFLESDLDPNVPPKNWVIMSELGYSGLS